MEHIKASIVLATFNGEKYILELLNSLRNQTYEKYEVIIVDDCSTDNTIKLIDDFISANNFDDNWKLIVNEENKGWRKNFIDGMKMAKGDYVFPCDQDDIWNSEKLDIMIDIMDSNNAIKVLASNIKEFYSNGRTKVSPRREDGKLIKHAINMNFFNNEYPGCAMCIRNDFFKTIVQYWEEDVPHDALLWRFSMFNGSLYTIGKSLTKQRIYATSTYNIEAKNNKTYERKIKEIKYMERQIEVIEDFVRKNSQRNTEECLYILNRSMEWLKNRKKLYNEWSIYNCIKLLKFLSCYERKRKYILDVFISMK